MRSAAVGGEPDGRLARGVRTQGASEPPGPMERPRETPPHGAFVLDFQRHELPLELPQVVAECQSLARIVFWSFQVFGRELHVPFPQERPTLALDLGLYAKYLEGPSPVCLDPPVRHQDHGATEVPGLLRA